MPAHWLAKRRLKEPEVIFRAVRTMGSEGRRRPCLLCARLAGDLAPSHHFRCALILFAFCASPLYGATPSNRVAFEAHAQRVAEPPIIDGSLEEEIWSLASVVDAFIQQEPEEGKPASERTEVRILYDSGHLFIGVHAFESRPDEMIATEMRRDSNRLLDEDNFQVIIDTFDDSRSGYMFVTNPLGAQLEQQIFEEGEGTGPGNNSNVHRNWDGVWHVATRRTADGWIAELSIPMTTLRFPQAEVQSWGINFMRNIRRKNERVFWAPIPKAYDLTRVSLAGTLHGLGSLNQGLDLRIKPFAIAGLRAQTVDGGLGTSTLSDAGLDVKYGVTSSLNLDLTLNTDFAQVEADEQQVNLTRFSLFFPEKREFFLENAGQFNVGTARQQAELFFSRRIGLSESGQPIPILGGARLTGKLGRNNIAVMDLQTEEALGNPAENFFVARYARDILSRSKVGGLLINKQSTSGAGFNRTMAADATLALGTSLTINSFLAKTSTPGVDAEDLAFYGRVGWLDPSWNLYAEYTDIQDNFNAEVGFVPRRGIRTTKIHVGPTPRPKKFNIREMLPMVNVTYTTDQTNRLVSRMVHYMIGFRMENGAFLNFIYNRFFEQLDEPFLVHPEVTIPAGAYRFGAWVFQFDTNPSRRLYERFRYSPQTFFGGTRTDLDAVMGFRVTERFAAEMQYRRNDVDLPGGSFVSFRQGCVI